MQFRSSLFQVMSRLDKLFFGKLRLFAYFFFKIHLRHNLRNSNYTTVYVRDTDNLLSRLCDKYGSDKGSVRDEGHVFPWKPHAYTNFYTLMFEANRSSVRNVFECGIGTSNLLLPANMGPDARPGASLRVWSEYFPNAKIIGGDIDQEIMFEENSIKTFVMDQTSSKSATELNVLMPYASFDIIIDDGLHTFEGNTKFFEYLKHTLAKTGVWVIEDLTPLRLLKVYKFLKKHYGELEYSFEPVLFSGKRRDLVMNSLIVIRHNTDDAERFLKFGKDFHPPELESTHVASAGIEPAT